MRYKYDLAGRVIETTQAGGDAFKLRTVYDLFGHKVADIDQNNFPAISSFDYFGLLLDRTDLGGARIHYTYDRARQLLNTTNSRYANNVQIVYEYDTAGQVIKVTDRSLNQVTEYAYDLAGRHVRERTTQASKVYQDNMLAYDNVGRLRHVGDGRMSIDIAYDKAGNRTQLRTHANVPNIGSAGERKPGSPISHPRQ